MKTEWLIFFYTAVSVMMVLFNVAFLAFEKSRAKRIEGKTRHMAAILKTEMERNAEYPTPAHVKKLEESLRRLPGMEAFDLCMEHLRTRDVHASDRYLTAIAPAFDRLAERYEHRKPLEQAYFAHIVKRWHPDGKASPAMLRTLMHLLRSDAFYVRQNAFSGLAKAAQPADFVEGALSLTNLDAPHSKRLLTELTLTFWGDRQELASEFLRRFDEFNDMARVGIVNAFRMIGLQDDSRMLEILNDRSANKEVRLACVRYFMRNRNDLARPMLLSMARGSETWEFSSVAASALASYPGEETVTVLKECLKSPVWHLRHNAAKSLYDLGCSLQGDLADIMAGSDRYARDMLEYRWDLEEGGKTCSM